MTLQLLSVPDTSSAYLGDRFLTLREVTAKTTISRSQIYRMISEGLFPAPIHLTPQMSRWKLSAVDAWMNGIRHMQPDR